MAYPGVVAVAGEEFMVILCRSQLRGRGRAEWGQTLEGCPTRGELEAPVEVPEA